jgi:DNA polymerase-1
MTAKKKKTRETPLLCLIDGTALVYRSYYAFIRSPLTNSRGEDVGAVYGFASSLLKLLEERNPDYVAVAFDTPEPTFRHEIYPEYKATREVPPDEMIGQFPLIDDLVEALGIATLELPGYEADDVIGTLARKAKALKLRPLIVSGDKDFFQLVDDSVTVLDPSKDIEYTPAEVEETFGVPPEKVIEVLGLAGDTSDNVPGVPGIGKKTALGLIREYGTIEEVLAHIEDVSGQKRRQNLTEFGEQALESRQLVTIDVDAPVELDLDALTRDPVDAERMTELLKRLELPSLLRRIVPARETEEADFALVSDAVALDKLVSSLEAGEGFAVDLETTSLDPLEAEIVGIAVSSERRRAFYVPIGHEAEGGLDRGSVLERFRGVLEDASVPKFGQNLKYDYKVLRGHGITMAPLSFDTMIASYLVDPGKRHHNLSVLALEHLERRMRPIEDLIGKGKDQLSFAQVGIEEAGNYSCEDAATAFELMLLFREKLEESLLTDLMQDVEMPLVSVLAEMELKGVALDVAVLEGLGKRLGGEIEELRAEVCRLADCEFNLDSPKQVGAVLFEKLRLPKGRRTKTGYSTDERVLEGLSEAHEVPGLILNYRQLMKLKAGYLDALPKLVSPITGRLHTSFNQTVTSTGRLSSSNPNLQNIPIRTEIGREIRKAFVADEGRVIVSADYSQIELRLMAHLSGDETLIAAFEAGKDVHRSTAALIFGESEETITPDQRDWAKTVNFGIMYGMSPYGLARQLEISNEEAFEFIETYFETYPRVREYTERVIGEAEKRGFATTILGRRRHVAGLDSDNTRIRGMAERVAVNTPIQGSAADLIKQAMLGVARRIKTDRLPCDMVLQVHDELVFEVDEDAIEEVGRAITDEMENPHGLALDVPTVVNVVSGANWHEAH